MSRSLKSIYICSLNVRLTSPALCVATRVTNAEHSQFADPLRMVGKEADPNDPAPPTLGCWFGSLVRVLCFSTQH